jgi:hypothetical protein
VTLGRRANWFCSVGVLGLVDLVRFEGRTGLTGLQVIDNSLPQVPYLPRFPSRITQNCPKEALFSGDPRHSPNVRLSLP